MTAEKDEDPSPEATATTLESPDVATEATEAAEVAPPAPTHPSRMVAVRRLAGRYRANRRSILLIALVMGSAGLTAGLYFFQFRPDRQIDDTAGEQAVRAASDGIVAVLSYSSDNLERDFANATPHLTGEFLNYYNKFSSTVVAPAVREKHLTQTAVIIRAATSQLRPESAIVLAYVNETVTSADKKNPTMTPSIVSVTLTKVDGAWLISKLDPIG
jgi:Mce-associated membrane protein